MNVQTKALIVRDDLGPWFEEHGLEMKWLKSAHLNLAPDAKGACVWLDAEFYKLNEIGNIYCDTETREAATGFISVPLKSWPPLTLVEVE